MPTLECKGVFEVALPEGWRAHGEPGEYYELTPEGEELGINISVYDARSLPSQDPEDLVRQYARMAGLDDVDQLHVRTPADPPPQRRYFSSFAHDGRDWLVGLLMFPGGVVVASSNCAAGDDEAFATGERIVASIAPLTKRGLRSYWRRSAR